MAHLAKPLRHAGAKRLQVVAVTGNHRSSNFVLQRRLANIKLSQGGAVAKDAIYNGGFARHTRQVQRVQITQFAQGLGPG